MSDLQARPRRYEAEGVAVLLFDQPVELTAAEAPRFRVLAEELVTGDLRVVIDLGAVGFLDSSGLSALIGIERMLAARRGELRLAAPTRDVLAVFELMRLHRLFEIYDTVDEAVASFRGGP